MNILILILTATSLFFILGTLDNVDGELYKKEDGTYIDKLTYESHVLFCSSLQREGLINATFDCAEYVLEDKGIENLQNLGLDYAMNKTKVITNMVDDKIGMNITSKISNMSSETIKKGTDKILDLINK